MIHVLSSRRVSAIRYIWKSETIKVFISLVFLAIAIVTADLMVSGHYASFGTALRDASFQVASISTTTGVTASVACIGNVGPGFGEVGSMANYAAFPAVLKATGMVEMLIGRLEIFPVLYLFRSMRAV